MAHGVRVPTLTQDRQKIDKDIELLSTIMPLKKRVEIEYDLFRRIWWFPSNKPVKTLVRKYLWPNIREWRLCAKNGRENPLRGYHIALQNALKRLKTE